MPQVHIASARLKNFLSFYEGTIEFDPGLTVIVGPNGSGKTSIFHALKFALGSNQREQRYSKWSDFIRHGARSAEVEITINANGQSRKIKRRIDRDGIPRAYVDGRRVKAAELRHLVDSLGLDVDNTLVFMPQERINALREMDPIEVRRLVEEGTGLDATRDRVSLEEVKVAQSRQKLEASVTESRAVEREVELLKHDLSRLEKKRALQVQEHELESEIKWATLDDLDQRLVAIKQEMETKESGLMGIIEESKNLNAKIAQEESKSDKYESRLEGLQKEMGRIDAQIEQEDGRLQKLEDEGKRVAIELQHLKGSLRTDKKSKSKTREDMDRIHSAKEAILEKQRGLRQELDETEIERTQIEEEMTAFSSWNTQRLETIGAYRTLQAEIKGKDLLLRSVREALQLEEADLQSIDSKWAHTWAVLEKTDEKELAQRKFQLEEEIATLNEQRFREASHQAQRQKDIDEIKHRIAESSARIPAPVRELKESIKEHGLKSVVGPVIELVTAEEDISVAVEAVLPHHLAFSFIVTSKADYLLLQKVRDKVGAPSPIILLQDNKKETEEYELPDDKDIVGWFWDFLQLKPEKRDFMRQAFGRFILVKDFKSAARVATKNGFKTVSQDGYVVVPHKLSVVSYPKHEPSGIVSTAPLQDQLAKIEQDLALTRKRLAEIVAKLEIHSNERENVIDLLAQFASWSGTWEKRKTLSESIPELQRRTGELDEQLSCLQREEKNVEKKLKELDVTQPPERTRLVGQRTAIKGKMRRLQGELSKAETHLRAMEKDEEQKRQELRRLDTNVTMYSESIIELKQEIKDSKNLVSTIMDTLDVMKIGRDKAEENYKTIKLELRSISGTVRSLSERLVETNLIIRDNRLQVMQAKKQMSNMEREKERVTNELVEAVRPATVRSLETVREQLIGVRHVLDDYSDVSESVAQIEMQLKNRLGKLRERVSELREEIDEAEATVKDIREQYHNGMNQTLRLVETEVNNILSSVEFQGRVRFQLSMNDGEYGVDFKTRIKGDAFGKLSAGSGGEKSLVAIGLILALQRFSPAPVYALDEIDIFLDATNTEMVSSLLHDSSRRSQFVLFTPAKTTHLLKHADKRLGVVAPKGVEPSVIIESPRFSGQ